MKVETKIFNGYKVTSNGSVFKKDESGCLSVYIDRAGYNWVDLYYKKRVYKWSVHRLIATVFIKNKYKKPCVNHIDGNKSNNYIDNLEWCTHKENTRHAINTGLIDFKKINKDKGFFNDLRRSAVSQLYSAGFTQYEIAKIFCCTQASISKAIKAEKVLLSGIEVYCVKIHK